jgi:hypothetical protein
MTTRFCKDCAFFTAPTACGFPQLEPFDLVTGEPVWPRSAAIERSHITADSCGREAKWFKPKLAVVPAPGEDDGA